jgi:integrase/recombinase XerD
VRKAFVKLRTAIGLRTATVRRRMHDLRHSFAVSTLIRWQRSGVEVGQRMPALSNYLGHVNPAGTWWYLSAAPELMQLAAQRLHERFGEPR